jgi:hypothetical protein
MEHTSQKIDKIKTRQVEIEKVINTCATRRIIQMKKLGRGMKGNDNHTNRDELWIDLSYGRSEFYFSL